MKLGFRGRCFLFRLYGALTLPVVCFISLSLLSQVASADEDSSGYQFPIGKLTTQASDPFVFGSKQLAPGDARWKEYRKPIKRFPDARACLVREEQAKGIVDLRKIDWAKPKYTQGLDVCLFRIFSVLKERSLIEEWLRFHEFALLEPGYNYKQPIVNSDRAKDTYRVKRIHASWSFSQYISVRPPSLFYQLTGKTSVRNFSATVALDDQERFRTVRFYYSNKFN